MSGVSGTGDYTSAPFTPTAPGTYNWIATYSGDASNNSVGPIGCIDPNEIATVSKAVPTISTSASP